MAGPYRGALAGRATITINGEVWNAVSELTYQPSGYVNETLKGQSAVEGFSQMPQEGFVSVQLRDRSDKKVSDLQGQNDLTVVAELASGKIVTCKNGWHVEVINVSTQEGTFEFKVESGNVTEKPVKNR
ncbi:phage tail protein [Acetobacteraceae bacterium]|nr:phage tail protein [Acetobacteraceae bacterium]